MEDLGKLGDFGDERYVRLRRSGIFMNNWRYERFDRFGMIERFFKNITDFGDYGSVGGSGGLGDLGNLEVLGKIW